VLHLEGKELLLLHREFLAHLGDLTIEGLAQTARLPLEHLARQLAIVLREEVRRASDLLRVPTADLDHEEERGRTGRHLALDPHLDVAPHLAKRLLHVVAQIGVEVRLPDDPLEHGAREDAVLDGAHPVLERRPVLGWEEVEPQPARLDLDDRDGGVLGRHAQRERDADDENRARDHEREEPATPQRREEILQGVGPFHSSSSSSPFR
jgi:hypothetical protein